MFYGWSPKTIDELDAKDMATYLRGAEIMKAREILEQRSNHDWPHLKKDRRQLMHRKLHRVAYPNERRNGFSFEEIGALLGLSEANNG